MRLGVNFRYHKDPSITGEKMVAHLRAAERAGFDSLWFFDSICRGNFDPDPLMEIAVAAAVTERIEVGTCILQIPLRHPVELAHRILGAHLLSNGRLRLGVGATSRRSGWPCTT